MYGRNFWRIFRTSGPARSHAPPKYGRQNSHISQKVLEGQNEYQTVRLVPLINLILIYIYIVDWGKFGQLRNFCHFWTYLHSYNTDLCLKSSKSSTELSLQGTQSLLGNTLKKSLHKY